MLTIAYVAKYQVNARFAECLMVAISELADLAPVIKSVIGKSNIAHARSILMTEWYDSAKPADIFFFIDSDHTFTSNDIRSVINLRSDLKAGLYANRNQQPTSVILCQVDTKEVDLAYAATGFLCCTYEATQKIHTYMKTVEKLDRVTISDGVPREENCIPFFHPVIENKGQKTYWLGEDFSFSLRAKKADLSIKGIYLQTLGHEIPILLYTKPQIKTWPKKSIVYYCGESRVPFGPDDDDLGGSEQAIVYLSAEFATKGYEVTVFGNIRQNKQGQHHNSVLYKSYNEFNPNDSFDTIILWRRYGLDILPKINNAARIFVDLHDPTSSSSLPENLIQTKVQSIFVKSNYHRSLYPQFPDSKFIIVANGLKTTPVSSLSVTNPKRERTRFCYTSSYDRGLVNILKFLWPKMKEAIPDATLHIHYGKTLLQSEIIEELVQLFKQPGVFEHGRSNYTTIHKEHQTCLAKLYITDTPLEIDCLSVREAAKEGCIPIMTTNAVFPERAGIHIDGDFKSAQIWKGALDIIIKLYNLPDSDLDNYRRALYDATLKQTWAETAEIWLNKINL